MTARHFLRQYEVADKKARLLKAEYDAECLLIDAIRSSSDNDGMPHGNSIGRPTEEKAIRLMDKAVRWRAAELKAIETRQAVFDVISEIEGVPGEVLYHRFILLESWDVVCDSVNYTWPTVRKYWHKGESIVEEKINTRCYNHISDIL